MTRGKQVFGAAGYRSAPAAAQGTRWPRRHPKPVPIAGVPGGSRDEIVNLEASGAQTHGIASLEDSLGVSVRVDHDAIKVKRDHAAIERVEDQLSELRRPGPIAGGIDRKSTRLNSSHSQISYAVFCLKKKKILRQGMAE